MCDFPLRQCMVCVSVLFYRTSPPLFSSEDLVYHYFLLFELTFPPYTDWVYSIFYCVNSTTCPFLLNSLFNHPFYTLQNGNVSVCDWTLIENTQSNGTKKTRKVRPPHPVSLIFLRRTLEGQNGHKGNNDDLCKLLSSFT